MCLSVKRAKNVLWEVTSQNMETTKPVPRVQLHIQQDSLVLYLPTTALFVSLSISGLHI